MRSNYPLSLFAQAVGTKRVPVHSKQPPKPKIRERNSATLNQKKTAEKKNRLQRRDIRWSLASGKSFRRFKSRFTSRRFACIATATGTLQRPLPARAKRWSPSGNAGTQPLQLPRLSLSPNRLWLTESRSRFAKTERDDGSAVSSLLSRSRLRKLCNEAHGWSKPRARLAKGIRS